MDSLYLDSVAEHLERRGIVLGPGYTDREIHDIERRCAFQFPSDLRATIQHFEVLAIPSELYNRIPSPNVIEIRRLRDLADIVQTSNDHLFSIVASAMDEGFWPPEWGERPIDLSEAYAVVRHHLRLAPPCIPVPFAYWFVGYGGGIPAEPHDAGNPFFSVHGTDIIISALDIAHVFERVGVPPPPWAATEAKYIPIWTETLDWTEDRYWPPKRLSEPWPRQ